MSTMTLTDQEIRILLKNLHKFTPAELEELEPILDELEARKRAQAARDDLIEFCKQMDPNYKVGTHHRMLANMLMDIAEGKKDRISVNIAPRHGKSQLVSIYFPAWFIGKYPDKKVLMVSHTADLAVDFGRKVRNLIATDEYKRIYPSVSLAADSKSAGRWNTNFGGEYFATGVGSALAGRGADLLLIDDPHNEQDIVNGNYEVFEKAWTWFTTGARTRLMPGGRIAIIQTRWHPDDLTGKVIKDMSINEGTDQYEVVEFPAILNENTPNEKALWPEQFSLDALARIRAGMPTFQWNAQYQQNPTAEGAAIIKREWWRIWEKETPPACEYIILAMDTAAETNNRADYTAITTWGVFKDERLTEDNFHIILLNAINIRLEFPELKDLALEQWNEWKPDSFIVEKKSSGVALYQELRRMGIPVSEFTPSRGTGDKMVRLNAVADLFRSGMVWRSEHRWAEEVVEQIAGFPAVSHDDLCDSTTLALNRFRNGGFVSLQTDYTAWDEDVQMTKYRPGRRYY